MKVTFQGVRGSIAVPKRAMLGYGGNTSCLHVTLSDGGQLILDAGTGIRAVGHELAGVRAPIHILLTHLHLDHVGGLMFFEPLFDPEARVTVWGPPSMGPDLRRRLARYISAPLSPIELRELPATVDFRAVPPGGWRIGSASIEAALINHRGATLGYRIEDGGEVLAYLPDHEPGLGADLEGDPAEWISGLGLARGATMLVHDSQYTEREYRWTIGWGHATVDQALALARRADVARLALFHHDPEHDDARLDAIGARAGHGAPFDLVVAREGHSFELSRAAGG